MSKKEDYEKAYRRGQDGDSDPRSFFDDLTNCGDEKTADAGFRDGVHDRLREEESKKIKYSGYSGGSGDSGPISPVALYCRCYYCYYFCVWISYS
jgi:hypothetical protein